MFFKHRSICLQCGMSTPGTAEEVRMCPCCGSDKRVNVPKKDGKKLWEIRWIKDADARWNARIDYVKNTMHIKLPDNVREIAEDCVRKRKEEETARIKEIADRSSIYTPTSITCPYCHSTNVSKISTIDRGISVGMAGLASGKLGKQWHCNKCKSNF